MVDTVIEGRVMVAQTEVVISEAGSELVVVLQAGGPQVTRAELLQGPEDLLLLPPEPPEGLDTQEPAQLQYNLADLQLPTQILIPIDVSHPSDTNSYTMAAHLIE